MAIRSSSAEWKGTLKEGAGTMKLGSGAYEGPFTFASRFESGPGTNPEELIGAAHAGCFSMFLAALLTNVGYTPVRIATSARVHLGAGPTITLIELTTQAKVPRFERGGLSGACRGCEKGLPGIEGVGWAGDQAASGTGEVGSNRTFVASAGSRRRRWWCGSDSYRLGLCAWIV